MLLVSPAVSTLAANHRPTKISTPRTTNAPEAIGREVRSLFYSEGNVDLRKAYYGLEKGSDSYVRHRGCTVTTSTPRSSAALTPATLPDCPAKRLAGPPRPELGRDPRRVV